MTRGHGPAVDVRGAGSTSPRNSIPAPVDPEPAASTYQMPGDPAGSGWLRSTSPPSARSNEVQQAPHRYRWTASKIPRPPVRSGRSSALAQRGHRGSSPMSRGSIIAETALPIGKKTEPARTIVTANHPNEVRPDSTGPATDRTATDASATWAVQTITHRRLRQEGLRRIAGVVSSRVGRRASPLVVADPPADRQKIRGLGRARSLPDPGRVGISSDIVAGRNAATIQNPAPGRNYL